LLLGLPHLVGVSIEWLIMLLGDTRLRKVLVVGGGVVVALAVLTIGCVPANPFGFWVLLGAAILVFPASGAFVTLAQGSLMALHPGKEERMMARWSLSGSLGNLVGPAILAIIFAAGLSWRWGYIILAVAALFLSAIASLSPFPGSFATSAQNLTWRDELIAMLKGALSAARMPMLLRWLVLLEVADLMMDIFLSYAPLYFANVAGLNAIHTSLVLSAMMVGSVVGDMIVVPLLEFVRGRKLVRISAWVTLLLLTAFLLLPGVWIKIGLAILLRITTLGWYAILKAEAYAAVPGRPGAVNALNSFSGVISAALVWLVGLTAQHWGLANAMWLLALAPLALLVFVPKHPKVANEGID
jgi:FSR family fosmidomycin resistance protein-like MFS transporter